MIENQELEDILERSVRKNSKEKFENHELNVFMENNRNTCQ
jgi:hypothetical protein